MNRAIFLDRDGVINEVLSDRVKFVNKPSDFFLLEGVGEAVIMFKQLGYKVFVVTNQGGIGLGYINHTDLEAIHHKMQKEIQRFGATIDDIAYCPHRPNEGCACRKPQSKMLFDLAKKHHIDRRKSYMVGDRWQDIEAGKNANMTTVLIGNGYVKKADVCFLTLRDFASWLIANKTDKPNN